MNEKSLGLMGVPTSAGAFAPGQEKAPAALREAGLVTRLEEKGLDIVDHGDSDVVRWRPDRENPYAQNLDTVVRIAEETASRVGSALSREQVPLVLGGDCTIGLGTVAGHATTKGSTGLIYFDLHPDLNVPESVEPGALDWMGMAHALGEERATTQLSRVGPRFPLIEDDDVFFFAYGPDNRTDWEREVMDRRNLAGISVDEVADAPEETATNALSEFGSQFDRLVVHFDVDVIDFTDLPLSENTGRNEGLAFDEAMRALTTLLSDRTLSGLTVTEINPDHGDASGETIDTFTEALSESVAMLNDSDD